MAAQLFVVLEPGHQSRCTTSVFFVAGALLLPLHLVALMCVLAHIPEWARHRYPWYIQTFNIANWVCASSAVYYIARAALDRNHLESQFKTLAAAGAIAAVACALVDHALLAQMLRFARGKSYRESGLFTFTASRPRSSSPQSASRSRRSGASAAARAVRARAADRRLPLAAAAEPRARRTHRLEDGALQRALLLERARGRARPREAVRPPGLDPARRSRSAARGEQHLRPSRRRRRPSRRRRRSARAVAAVRHRRPLRR